MKTISRRALLSGLVTAAAILRPAEQTIGFGFSTYGMRTLPWDLALRTVAEVGYDGVEIAIMPEWPTEPKLLPSSDRNRIRSMLGDLRLALPSLLETLQIDGTLQKRSANLERLRRAIDLGHDLAPDKPPVVETTIGRKVAEWEQVKGFMAEELRQWARVAEAGRTVVCFKPHAGSAIHNPERALWMVREVGSPFIRVAYDYSHMSLEGLTLAGSLRQLLPVTAFIHVKDASGDAENQKYLLPGDGSTNYVEYFRLLAELGYRGFVVVEVSGQIHRQPGYEPVATAKLCYRRLALAFDKAGIKRPGR